VLLRLLRLVLLLALLVPIMLPPLLPQRSGTPTPAATVSARCVESGEPGYKKRIYCRINSRDNLRNSHTRGWGDPHVFFTWTPAAAAASLTSSPMVSAWKIFVCLVGVAAYPLNTKP